jgi:hypothetical protein
MITICRVNPVWLPILRAATSGRPYNIFLGSGYDRSAINKWPKTKKHYSTLDRSSAFLFGFAFSFGHPGWAKAISWFALYFWLKGNLRGGFHPLSLHSPQTADYIRNPGGISFYRTIGRILNRLSFNTIIVPSEISFSIFKNLSRDSLTFSTLKSFNRR